jgi:inorganic pyrophosphatase
MNLEYLEAGINLPNDIHVIVEIPAHSSPVKYEMNKEANVLMVNRFLGTAMFYPCDYGFIPHTLAEDGDPIDVILITPSPLFPGAAIPARPVGLLRMTDESGPDTKILAVPIDRVSPLYKHVKSPNDLDENLLAQIAHFFAHYKDLEVGKWSKVGAWEDAEIAKAEIMASVERYKQQKNITHK